MKLSIAIVATIGSVLVVQPMQAQDMGESGSARAYSTREALQDLLDRLDKSANSSAYSATLRARVRAQAELIRTRLAEGDFQVGDRIELAVEDQPFLSDTFVVDQGLVLTLPTVGDVSLTGVLRSELRQRVAGYLGGFLREPIVRARALIRVAVLGGVVAPGFYDIAGEALLTDAFMMAGGLTPTAKVEEILVERGEDRIWEGRLLQAAMIAGRTLDQLSLKAGDRIFIPESGTGLGGSQQSVQALGILIALPLTIAAVLQLF